MKIFSSLTVSLLIVSAVFSATNNLHAGTSETHSLVGSIHEISGKQQERKISLIYSGTKQPSQNERAQLEKEKKLFIERTSAIRKDIFEKKLALRDELRKNPPNGQKLSKLRKEILILKSRLNRQRYAFLKRISTINPQIEGYHERRVMGNEGVKN